MKVYKFGGASVRDAIGIKNLGNIVSATNEKLVIVISALGKTTNALEILLKTWFVGKDVWKEHFEALRLYHTNVIDELFPDPESERYSLDCSFNKLRKYLEEGSTSWYDYEYDQVVSYGELWSTIIVAAYLNSSGLKVKWIDISKLLVTDERFRDANVVWDASKDKLNRGMDFKDVQFYVTQGFIGGTNEGKITTLGREGSDYTAAIIANMLNAESVTVWKDVPGLLNADPKWLPDSLKIDEVSYREAVEMTFSGAKIIHPKTIKPLHNRNIPLYVKSFLAPSDKGTVIKSDISAKHGLPVYIKKENQIMISIVPRDFSFTMGEKLADIFYQFVNNGIRVNIVEASAVSIDVCIDDERARVESLLDSLKEEYSATYNENVEMLSIRHYTAEAIDRITKGREILLEQRTRSTVRFVVRVC